MLSVFDINCPVVGGMLWICVMQSTCVTEFCVHHVPLIVEDSVNVHHWHSSAFQRDLFFFFPFARRCALV